MKHEVIENILGSHDVQEILCINRSRLKALVDGGKLKPMKELKRESLFWKPEVERLKNVMMKDSRTNLFKMKGECNMQKRETMEDLLRNEELLKLAKQVVDKADEDAKVNPTSDEIQVVVVEPEKKPYKKTIKNHLDAMQEIVDGYIEIVPFGKTESGGSLAMTLNEEGKIHNKPFNRIIVGKGGSDMLVGTFFITAYNMQGDNITLTDKECERMIKKFTYMEVYV